MQLPVDIKAVIDEATNIDEARRTSLSVSVYLDDSAPGDVQAHVRQAFASASPHARVSLMYLDGRPFVPFSGDDMAVIVAGLNEQVGEYAAQVRAVGVPVMVVTTLPSLVADMAKAAGNPIPHGDLIAPKEPKAQPAPLPAPDAVTNGAEAVQAIGADFPNEPYALDRDAVSSLNERMGGWVIAACNDKRLAFALAFPFVRKPLSLEAVNSTALQNAGVGLLVIIPGADMPVMTLNQAKMLLMIAASYGEELNMERVKELAALVGGAFACRAVARQLVAFVPALGWAVKAAIGYTGTIAMGRAAIEYYEDGATFGKLTDAVAEARDKVVRAAASRAASKAQATGAKAVEGVRNRAVQAAHAAGGVRNAAVSRFGAGKARS
ncbi:hypothetical protein C1876_03630 [Eggerthella sinensis]|uniref:DUF697 domain-containing protein n=2 Tax=Eggerthella sinensis TaxID=242230 RepID=A0ABX9HNG5_9ACTN|nr:hypothetical protein [Eggerthella sinensis]RDB70811.1 hypothetical protein C1876_03630 [Eggerthella sinensis]